MNAVSTHARCVVQNAKRHTVRTGVASRLSNYRSQFAYKLVCQRNNSGITKPDIYHSSRWPATVTIYSLSPLFALFKGSLFFGYLEDGHSKFLRNVRSYSSYQSARHHISGDNSVIGTVVIAFLCLFLCLGWTLAMVWRCVQWQCQVRCGTVRVFCYMLRHSVLCMLRASKGLLTLCVAIPH